MTPDELTLGFIALVLGGVGWRNPTTVVLALSYLIPKLIFWLSGWGFGTVGAFRVDMAIIMLIYVLKLGTPHPWCRMKEPSHSSYRSFHHHICALWLERTQADRFVLACFPAAWLFYGVDDAALQWWGLIGVWLAQLGVSFWEALEQISNHRAANAVPDNSNQSDAEFAWALAHGGGGNE